jgi:hypothetical protein
VLDASNEDVPVEPGLELGTIPTRWATLPGDASWIEPLAPRVSRLP